MHVYDQPTICESVIARCRGLRILGVGAPNQSNKTDLALAARSEVASSARVFWFGGALGVLVWRGGWVSAGVGLAVWMCGWVAWCGRAGRGPSRPAAGRSGRRGGFARLQGLFRVLWGVAGGGRMRAFPDWVTTIASLYVASSRAAPAWGPKSIFSGVYASCVCI